MLFSKRKSKVRIAVLVSGGGTNLQAIIDAQKKGIIKSGKVELVVSNNPNAYALIRAHKADIATEVIEKSEYPTQADFEKRLAEILEANDIELIVLAGFMRILTGDFTSKYEKRIINVHPALIPSFCGEGYYGLRVHKAALDYGVKVTGATVHYVNHIPDGGEIILQKAVYIQDGDTPEILQKRVMTEAEWIILPQAVQLVSEKIIAYRENEMNIYKTSDIGELLATNTYPGRGIVIGKSDDGTKAAVAYFIMGRSENSRNRVFTETEDGIRTEAFDPSKMVDPSLIIYHPVRELGNDLIVTNGDQTDTIRDFIKDGKTFEQALDTRCFEPDAPNFTPRVSGIVYRNGGDFTYKLSILKSADAEGSQCNRFTYSFAPVNGIGHFIHTYSCDGNPIPSFVGDPERVAIPNDIDDFTGLLWENLNEQNKVSLFVRFVDLETGVSETRIVNKNA